LIIKEIYQYVLRELYEYGKISGKEISFRKDQDDLNLVNLFYSESKYAGGSKNYYELFILPNGALFISEPFLEEII
jgi:hypothetical protein